MQVHQNQIEHVRKGCLTRHREDVRSDGSRIESSHKAWNGIMQTHPCGIVMFSALGHDFVLRQNLCLATQVKNLVPGTFVASLHGSHHISLINHIAIRWDSLHTKFVQRCEAKKITCTAVDKLPCFTVIKSTERFGLVKSEHAETFGGLFKEEEVEDDISGIIDDVPTDQSDSALEEVLKRLNIDGELCRVPANSFPAGK